MIQLAPKKLCTGCGACAFVCGKNCIVMKENEVGIVYPEWKCLIAYNVNVAKKFVL